MLATSSGRAVSPGCSFGSADGEGVGGAFRGGSEGGGACRAEASAASAAAMNTPVNVRQSMNATSPGSKSQRNTTRAGLELEGHGNAVAGGIDPGQEAAVAEQAARELLDPGRVR